MRKVPIRDHPHLPVNFCKLSRFHSPPTQELSLSTLRTIMPPLSALVSNSVDETLQDIERQFHLDSNALVALTKAFLDEVTEGLGVYGHPMAMMYALSFHNPFDGSFDCALFLLQPYFRHWCARWI